MTTEQWRHPPGLLPSSLPTSGGLQQSANAQALWKFKEERGHLLPLMDTYTRWAEVNVLNKKLLCK